MLNNIFEGREETADSKKHIARLFLEYLKTGILVTCTSGIFCYWQGKYDIYKIPTKSNDDLDTNMVWNQ